MMRHDVDPTPRLNSRQVTSLFSPDNVEGDIQRYIDTDTSPVTMETPLAEVQPLLCNNSRSTNFNSPFSWLPGLCSMDGFRAAARAENENTDQPLHVLSLDANMILDSFWRKIGFFLCTAVARSLPAITFYGGTMALAWCSLHHQWSFLFFLTMYSIYILLTATHMAVFSTYGIWKLWNHAGNDWHRMWIREQGTGNESEAAEQMLERVGESSKPLDWADVIHIVIIPNYKTPHEVLCSTLDQLKQYSLATKNLGVCLAMEEHEDGAGPKAAALQKDYADSFFFICSTFHPAGLPNHTPGKCSNASWAFEHLLDILETQHRIFDADPRVVLTCIDDDSNLHEHYFDCLTYQFLKADREARYMTLWQPPIVQCKNYTTLPVVVRNSSIWPSLHELACLADPFDYHVTFSSFSMSLKLASAVGGWDPNHMADDWHMIAKCVIKTQGRARCEAIFLPLINYVPEESTTIATLQSRWTQAKRHALGMAELVYVCQALYLASLELKSFWHFVALFWRVLPMIGKMASTHFCNGTLAFWPFAYHALVKYYNWSIRCEHLVPKNVEISEPAWCQDVLASHLGLENRQVILSSWMVYVQQKGDQVFACSMLTSALMGALLFRIVQERVDGDIQKDCVLRNAVLHWFRIVIESCSMGWVGSMLFGAIPEWIASVRIMKTLQFHHTVAGMKGRHLSRHDTEENRLVDNI